MMNIFLFNVAIPVSYWATSSEDNNFLEKTLANLNLSFDTEELQLPAVKANNIRFDVSGNTILPEIIQSYFNIESFVYDIHGFKILKNYLNCSESLAYSCIEFDCSFAVSDLFLDEYNNQLEDGEDNYLWEIQEATYEKGGNQVCFGATETFSEIIYSNTSSLFALMNLARPGCIRSKLIFIDRYFYSKDLSSEVPDIKIFNVADTAKFMKNIENEEMYIKWGKLSEVSICSLWAWYKKLTSFSKKQESNVMRALERYFLLFSTNQTSEILLLSIAALEALYVFPFNSIVKKSKQSQLIQNITCFLNIDEIYGGTVFPERFKNLYNQRSRIIHGDKPIPNPFRHSLNNDLKIEKAAEEALFLLVISLREICGKNLMKLSFYQRSFHIV